MSTVKSAIKEMKRIVRRNKKDGYLGEEIRNKLENRGIAFSNPQTWGAVFRLAVENGIIMNTGEYRKDSAYRIRPVYVAA